MNKIISYFILLVLIVNLFSSCQKIMDYYDVEDKKKTPSCQLSTISYTDLNDQTVSIKYFYDNQGRPTSVNHPDQDVGEYSEVFTYDNLGRLENYTTYIYAGENKVYIYEGDSRLPLRDTAIDIWGRKYTENFQFDDRGRIIRVDRIWAWSPQGIDEVLGDPRLEELVYMYYYDIRGNRQESPLGPAPNHILKYSDKPSIISLNPVFQLLYWDYSKNSSSPDNAQTYNEHNLPLTFEKSSVVYAYDCK